MHMLRAAVIGAGFVGRAHIEALRRLGVKVEGVLGSSADRARETARSLGLDQAYRSLEELARDSSLDAVHVCTPNHLHFEMSRLLLESGKHVMCEKPLTMDSQQSAELVELAQKQKRVGAVCYNLRYYPLCQQAHALVESGAIGLPRLVHGSFLQDWLFYPSDWNWRLEPELGGKLRAVTDIGTHWLDLMTWITGKRVTEVCADLATVLPTRSRPRERVETFQNMPSVPSDEVKITTDDYASILLHFEDSLRGAVTVSQVSAGRKARMWFEVDGSKGSLAWNSESPNRLWIGHRGEPNRSMIKDPALMSPPARKFAAYPGGHTEGYPDTFVQLFRDFYGYISAGDLSVPRPFPTFETGHEEMVLSDAIAASAQGQRWVKVGKFAGASP
jgi:predicted dehydrogenase